MKRHRVALGERRKRLAQRVDGGGAEFGRLAFQRPVSRADFERALHRGFETAPDRDIERQRARLHRDAREAGTAENPMHALFGGECERSGVFRPLRR